ncbi:peptidoglycan DD-metalloendopeptidase family protein [Arsukibacterium indicum]|uniref:Peptidoglycan DD-metalloendopeptidase family protein n=1 Tax=Arsukibacterium indicum TaxID=2848612 RepID=A0ABS6MHN9_9GAMM|nr:peptidoglycan DD-metalloendopeptidase family protein [Arsukibacterium indicum]MBV2128331.1 peptidoglycan DD-metalloendopeptidase family protein [Arsukibacterium indicum]
MLLMVLAACTSSSGPAPVTTLELRENPYRERNRGSLAASQYVVQRGDTLYSIAFRAGLDVRTLASRNNIKSPYIIYPGQVLQLVASSTGQVAAKKSQPTSKSATNTSARPQPGQVSKATGTAKTATTNSKQAKSNSSANATKPVASSNQTRYVQTVPAAEDKKTANNTSVGNKVQWRWPVKGKIVSRFSASEHGNKGVDIAGQEGSRINAAADGQVVYAGSALRGYGNLIIIKHNDDYLSAYAHNKRILVAERQQVRAGQQIAEMGSTDATDSRLHFEIRFRGKSVDPLRYLP